MHNPSRVCRNPGSRVKNNKDKADSLLSLGITRGFPLFLNHQIHLPDDVDQFPSLLRQNQDLVTILPRGFPVALDPLVQGVYGNLDLISRLLKVSASGSSIPSASTFSPKQPLSRVIHLKTKADFLRQRLITPCGIADVCSSVRLQNRGTPGGKLVGQVIVGVAD